MLDFIVRDCGRVGFLPIIQKLAECPDARPTTLYRGEHHSTMGEAWERLTMVWEGRIPCSLVRQYKDGHLEEEEEEQDGNYEPTQEDFDAAIMFLTSLTDKGPMQIRAMLSAFLTDETSITSPRSYSKLYCLNTAARTIRTAPGMSKVLNALKASLLEDN